MERLKEVNALLKIGGAEDKEVIDLDDENEEIVEDEYSKQRKREYVR